MSRPATGGNGWPLPSISSTRRGTFIYEWKLGHAPGAQLVQLPEAAAALPKDAPYAVVWAAGFRASTAASVLERVGFTDVAVPEGGGGA